MSAEDGSGMDVEDLILSNISAVRLYLPQPAGPVVPRAKISMEPRRT